jgi:hypothetical protein
MNVNEKGALVTIAKKLLRYPLDKCTLVADEEPEEPADEPEAEEEEPAEDSKAKKKPAQEEEEEPAAKPKDGKKFVCPHKGGRFGVDRDKFNECGECAIWNDCDEEKDRRDKAAKAK